MSDRTPATEKGTADRIEADDGGYWVRLVTKQALRREGECMQNCLARGEYSDTVGEEDLVSTAVWSLRKADGVSYMDISVHVQRDDIFAGNAEGPKNSQPSGWSCRQLRHLVATFRDAGAALCIHEGTALTGEDGRTWRHDKAPQEVRDAYDARQRREAAERLEAARARGDTMHALRNDPHVRAAFNAARRTIVGDGPINPPVDTECAGVTDADSDALRRGIIHHVEAYPNRKRITMRFPISADVLKDNRNGTWALHYNGADQPAEYLVTGLTSESMDGQTVTLEIPLPERAPPSRFLRTLDGTMVEVPNQRWCLAPPLG